MAGILAGAAQEGKPAASLPHAGFGKKREEEGGTSDAAVLTAAGDRSGALPNATISLAPLLETFFQSVRI